MNAIVETREERDKRLANLQAQLEAIVEQYKLFQAAENAVRKAVETVLSLKIYKMPKVGEAASTPSLVTRIEEAINAEACLDQEKQVAYRRLYIYLNERQLRRELEKL